MPPYFVNYLCLGAASSAPASQPSPLSRDLCEIERLQVSILRPSVQALGALDIPAPLASLKI
jgi:hypothetical protein